MFSGNYMYHLYMHVENVFMYFFVEATQFSQVFQDVFNV